MLLSFWYLLKVGVQHKCARNSFQLKISRDKLRRPTAGGGQTYLQSPFKSFSSPHLPALHYLKQAFSCRGRCGKTKVLALNKKKWNQSTCISRRAVRLYSSILTILPLFLCWSVQRGGGQGEEWGSLSLRPESLAVFSARAPGSVCQGKFIVKAGGPTHIHTSSVRTQTCVSLPLSLCRLATKSSATESVAAKNHYGNQHRGPGCGYSWIGVETFFWHLLSATVDYRVPALKCPSRIGRWSLCELFLYLKNRQNTQE